METGGQNRIEEQERLFGEILQTQTLALRQRIRFADVNSQLFLEQEFGSQMTCLAIGAQETDVKVALR